MNKSLARYTNNTIAGAGGEARRLAGRVLAVAAVAVASVLPMESGAVAAEVRVAVAANFTEPARKIGALYETASGHKLILSFGSTGQFYAQITQGAPFDVLLSADQATPRKGIDAGYAVAGTARTYARGRLALFSRDKDRVTGEATLRAGTFAKIAIANPSLAPYGAAAMQTMQALGVAAALQPKIVTGASIAQAFQFVETGNAELGFVALSQVIGRSDGSQWVVPETLHAPIAQDAVLLKRGADNAAAQGFLGYLNGATAQAVVESYGYGRGE